LVTQLTGPGDLVIDLFCQGPVFIQETVGTGRRALGLSINPLNLLVSWLGLEHAPEPDALKAAFTRLADTPKGDISLQRHVIGLYRTRSPKCAGQGIAEWFAWDGEALYPYSKAVRCPNCEDVQEGPTDEEDIATARGFEPRGLAYHLGLNRVAPLEHPSRESASELMELYTPRNLSALVDISTRLENLQAEELLCTTLQGILLEVFDRCSSLTPPEDAPPRPRILRPRARFLERNAWFELERELERVLAYPRQTRDPPAEAPPYRSPDLKTLLSTSRPAYTLYGSAAADVSKLLPERAAQLILIDPPRPDGVFWALCALWSGWLWDNPAAHAMRPYLRRRRFDWEWHQRVLQNALGAASSVLDPGGYLVGLFASADGELTASFCLAASRAGYKLLRWGTDSPDVFQSIWQPPVDRPTADRPTPGEPTDAASLSIQLANAAAEIARACLTERGEPTPRPTLQASVRAGLCQLGLFAQTEVLPPEAPSPIDMAAQALERGLSQLDLQITGQAPELLWLPELDGLAIEPLADRIELEVWQAFQSQPAWQETELLRQIYARFHGPLTPSRTLVLKCIRSYGHEREGIWHRRDEDDPQRRKRELRELAKDLEALGKRIGFKVAKGKGWDIRWQKDKQDVYLFILSTAATLGRYLLYAPPLPPGASPCLVFPGGRAELLMHKLQRDPRFSSHSNWMFIKFRHLRRLTAEGADRRTFEAVLHLDPVTEKEGVQIPLMLGGAS
jgi:hypothetical protein